MTPYEAAAARVREAVEYYRDRGFYHATVAADDLAALLGQGVPEGWKLVPVEPTSVMLEGACDGHTPDVPMRDGRLCPLIERRKRVWSAMLAAAPPPPAASSNEAAIDRNDSSEEHRNQLMGKVVDQRTDIGALKARIAQMEADRDDTAALVEVIRRLLPYAQAEAAKMPTTDGRTKRMLQARKDRDCAIGTLANRTPPQTASDEVVVTGMETWDGPADGPHEQRLRDQRGFPSDEVTK